MDTTTQKIKQENDQGTNHFAHVPDDVLLLILSKVDGLKNLFGCSLVSKHFNSTVHLIENVSLTIHSEPSSYESTVELNDLLCNISSFTTEQILRFIKSSSLRWLSFLLFLRKFQQLKTISLKFTCTENLCSFSLSKMKVRFSGTEAVVENVVFIKPSWAYQPTPHGYPVNPFEPPFSIRGPLFSGCGLERIAVLCLLLKCQPTLEGVVIKNTNEPCALVLKGKHLVAWRNSIVPGGIIDSMIPDNTRRGIISDLHLPVSGYLMRHVRFIITNVEFATHAGRIAECVTCRNVSAESVSDDGMTWEYVGSKSIIDEVVHVMHVEEEDDDDDDDNDDDDDDDDDDDNDDDDEDDDDDEEDEDEDEDDDDDDEEEEDED